jgi:uncharacterized protein (TIGR02597 family)
MKPSPSSSRLASAAAALSLSIVACLPLPVSAQTTATTDPVGFATITCPAGSDTRIGLPLTRPADFVGAVQSIAGNVITVAGTPNWTANQFVHVAGTQPNTYFVLVGPHATTNPKEGRAYTVTANGANTLTLDLNGDSISDVAADTQISVIPYWTLATVFPASDANVSFKPSASVFSLETQILIPDYTSVGTNLAPTTTYFFFNGAWRQVGQPTTVDHGEDILAIRDQFIVRNNTTATSLTSLGGVLMKKITTPLSTETSTAQDNFVSVPRPVDVKLNDLGLISSGAFTPTTSIFNIQDQLLVSDNAQVGINKAPDSTYFYFNGAWRKVGQPTTSDFGNDTIKLGTGFLIRKAPSASGATAFWINDKTY